MTIGPLTLLETDEFYFDPAAAERPIRFIEKYLKHWEGRFAGQPFTLLEWQTQIIRALFGWKRRADGLRRYRELYLLTAKGAGKTPMLAAAGMYMLLADNEAGAHVISCATDFQQANLTLDAAKKYIAADKRLGRLCEPKQFEIRAPKNSKWTVLSGTAEGRQGFRPSCLLMDEAHEWPNSKLYDALTANTTKRQATLTLVTTNAGGSQTCFAWQLHERAQAVLRGDLNASRTLLPVIYEAPESLAWDSEAAAKAANPSLGDIIKFEALEPEIEKARQSPEAESRYRRLYLSQWTKTGAGRWLDMDIFDRAVDLVNPADHIGEPLYIALDLSLSDDLCAAVYVWARPDRFYVKSHFWMPRATAERYAADSAIPYLDWADGKHITLLDEPTISSSARKQIAAHVIAMSKAHKVKCVAYDPYRAEETIAALEAAKLTCVPVRQGFGVSHGCHELERRLKEGSIVIDENPVMRFCAENTEVKQDDRGNIWTVKPDARNKWAGQRAKKIDGIAGLVTALTEARKHNFPILQPQFRGAILVGGR